MNPADIVKGEIYAVYGDDGGELNSHGFMDISSCQPSIEPEPEYIIDDLYDENGDSRSSSPPSQSSLSTTSNLYTGHDLDQHSNKPVEEFISGDLFSDDEQPQQASSTNSKEIINGHDRGLKKLDKWVKHKCPYCDFFSFLGKLKWHCNKKHLDQVQDKKFNCPKCGVNFSNFNLLMVHIERHESGGQHCLICKGKNKKIFQSHQLLQEHLNTHAKLILQPCTICGYLSNSTRDLAKHRKEFHSTSSSTTTISNEIDHPASKNEQFKCDECILTYKRKIELEFHLLEYHQNSCPYQGCPTKDKDIKFSNRLELANHITGHEISNECKFCGSCKFPNTRELNNHICSRHTGEMPQPSAGPSKTFICTLCHKEISNKFINHKDVCPMKTKTSSKIICGIDSCKKEFRVKSAHYFKHKREVHGVGIFRCCHESCGKSLVFRSVEERINHWNLRHYGRSPFVCKICNKSFNFMAKYTTHVRQAKCQFNQDKKQSAGACAATSSSNDSIYLSKTFKCNICSLETFTDSRSYLKHLEIIHGIGKFTCGHQKCSYNGTFKTIIQRESHWNEKHHGQSPFKCGKCNKSFKILEYMEAHFKTDCVNLSLSNLLSNTEAEGSKIIRAIPQLCQNRNAKTEEIETITID